MVLDLRWERLKLRKLVTDKKIHVFPGLVSRGEGRSRRVWDYWNGNVLLFGVKIEALILFNEEHLKLQVPLGWEW